MQRALVLDIGGVVIRTPFEMLETAERARGLPPGSLGRRGPFDPAGDPDFDEVRTGAITERDHWQRRVDHAASVLGIEPEFRAFMHVLYDLPEPAIVRPEIATLVDEVRAAGIRLGMLTNDLYDFHGRDWVERMEVLARADVLVDVSRHGVLKPDPAAFAVGIDAMGGAAEDLVFLDDQPVNVAGARKAGMEAHEVDVTRPAEAVSKARAALGLT